jgi:gliding motility-associated-like protein
VDTDDDNDGILDTADNAPLVPNPDQLDTDGDGEGDVVDTDDDNDGILDTADNAPLVPNPDQLDTDGDGISDVIDTDDDGDGILDTADNAPLVPNPDQLDTDGDGISDVIDTDDDNDGVLDGADNCPLIYNSDQLDTDGDGIGDVCDSPIDNKLKVSQAITPNGDGINDFWMIQGIEYHPNTKVSVFNRWGSEVYHSNNYNNDWNGNGLDGDTLPKSSYFYKIDMDGKGITYLQGWLYITK